MGVISGHPEKAFSRLLVLIYCNRPNLKGGVINGPTAELSSVWTGIFVSGRIFARCMDKEEDEFKVVRLYPENPGATITETAEATGVAEQTILRFLRDGRLLSGPAGQYYPGV